MLVFYVLPVGLAVSCIPAMFLSIFFTAWTRQKGFQTLVPILGILQLSFVIAFVIFLGLFYVFGYDLQVSLALPYIQQALDEQCSGNNLEASTDGFYIEDIFRWKSSDNAVECTYIDGWTCSCQP